MKLFNCNICENPLFFENYRCERCGGSILYDYESLNMVTVQSNMQQELVGDNVYGKRTQYCKNHSLTGCNWLVAVEGPSAELGYCRACEFNRTIPNLEDIENLAKWRKLEIAKHRLIYQLKKLKLPLVTKDESPEKGLCFDFISTNIDNTAMTGHSDGVITIILSEADSVHREQLRKQMSEPYRTLIGHFRHEIGHFYWDRLIAPNQNTLSSFREVFGDERVSYTESLKTYYSKEVNNWDNSFISKYATAHPWEDWAETWAHYLHIMDTMETAFYFGLGINPIFQKNVKPTLNVDYDPYENPNFSEILEHCLPNFFAMNSMNRSMGMPDAYPFIVSQEVIVKLNWIHQLMQTQV